MHAAGRIERDRRGEPTGVLRESATDLVSRLVPETTADEYEAGLLRALAAMNRVGIVSFQEASAREPIVAAYRAVARQRTHLTAQAGSRSMPIRHRTPAKSRPSSRRGPRSSSPACRPGPSRSSSTG
ncbi:MAG: amidohydrolase family protein [Vicinamibacterales bacterium]